MSFATAFGLAACLLTSVPLVHSATLVANLNQDQTNGVSNLGTVNAPDLPSFLTNNPLPYGHPWGLKNATNTDPYEAPPVTNVTRQYHFVVERAFKSPDGVNKSVILVNGQFPGPTISANWGDVINVTVDNRIDNEGTSMHWHGFLQKESPWFDGVPGIQQCPIAPGQSFTYSFKADLYGTSWYHSHYSGQYADGLLGPIVVYGPNTTFYDVDVGPVVLNDWNYDDYYSITKTQLVPTNQTTPPTAPFSDNNLINGKNNASCSSAPAGVTCVPNAGLSKFIFQKGKTHRLRLINAAAEAIQRFTIDGHELTVIANDFVPVKPYKTNVVTLGVGQRTDVLVTANSHDTFPVWMRSDISALCSRGRKPNALAAIYLDGTDTTVAPTTAKTVYNDTQLGCKNDDLNRTIPFKQYTAPANPSVTQEIDITFRANETNIWGWYMNNSTFRANYDISLLDNAFLGNTSYPFDPHLNIYNFGENYSVRIILKNRTPVSHPMHLHGHNFYVLADGVGEWDGKANTGNVQRRDTQIVQPSADRAGTIPGYLVLEFVQDNPGVWPFHCHIAWHVSSGLYVNVFERPHDITQSIIPSITAQTCNAWDAYAATHVVDQIDSGE